MDSDNSKIFLTPPTIRSPIRKPIQISLEEIRALIKTNVDEIIAENMKGIVDTINNNFYHLNILICNEFTTHEKRLENTQEIMVKLANENEELRAENARLKLKINQLNGYTKRG